MALVPLDRVLLAFDDLSDYPASRAVNAEHHELEAFVFMLVDLGLIPNRTTVTLSRCELADLSEWFAQHCRVAVDFWRYAFAHIYSNAREMAGSAEAWLERLKAVRFAAGGPGSAWVLYVRHLEGHTLRATRATSSSGRARSGWRALSSCTSSCTRTGSGCSRTRRGASASLMPFLSPTCALPSWMSKL